MPNPVMPAVVSVVMPDYNQIKGTTSRPEWPAPASVVVVGDVMLDRYWRGVAARVSPEAPVPIVRVTSNEERVGGAANVAANAAALGARVSLLGVTGDDTAGDTLEALCKGLGLSTSFIRCKETPTTVKLRVISQHQQLLRLDFEGLAPEMINIKIRDALDDLMMQAKVVVFSDYAKGTLGNSQGLLERVKAAGKIAIVDPKGVDFSRYAGADLVTPNLSEFEATVGKCRDNAEIVARARSLCAAHGFGAVLVTRGEHGMTLVPAAGQAVQLAARARDVFDVTGAGDTVCAALAWALAGGVALERAIELANSAAGIAVGKLGTAVVTAAELAESMTANAARASFTMEPGELISEVAAARQRGLRIVMTNGCFDVLHVGHVRHLEEAAALGDRLIVAVNSDDSVRRLKGPSRPINTLADRIEILRRLRAVDWVVSFDTDTPHDLIAHIAPDLLVKGGDYRINEIAGADEVLRAGGNVLTLPYHAGFSSTRMIEAVAETVQVNS